jgi:hypothetical protein
MTIIDFYYACWKYWMEVLYEVKSLRNDADFQKKRIDRMEEVIYSPYN